MNNLAQVSTNLYASNNNYIREKNNNDRSSRLKEHAGRVTQIYSLDDSMLLSSSNYSKKYAATIATTASTITTATLVNDYAKKKRKVFKHNSYDSHNIVCGAPMAFTDSPSIKKEAYVTANSDLDCTEFDSFLICENTCNDISEITTKSPAIPTIYGSSKTASQSHRYMRACWSRSSSYLTRNYCLSYFATACLLCTIVVIAYMSRSYAKALLYWIESQNLWIIFAMCNLLFIIVSFPIAVGYFVLLITSGYFFGCFKGWLTVIFSANLGVVIAHATIQKFRHQIPMQRIIKNETGRAILRVISGPKAFKVVLFTRLTPIPFGLQNAIFGVSNINGRDYHLASALGLLPAQTINVYLGSTLRSMHEVLNNNDAKLTGYISFVCEVICGVALMFWVLQKARKELADTLLTDIANDGKHIDIQV